MKVVICVYNALNRFAREVRTAMRRFVLATTHNDYEAHDGTPLHRKAYIKVNANNYRHAVIKANEYIKRHNSQFNGYDFIPLSQNRMRGNRR